MNPIQQKEAHLNAHAQRMEQWLHSQPLHSRVVYVAM